MPDNLTMAVRTAGDGQKLAVINGKLYKLLAAYEHWKVGGWFFLMVAGRTPLKPDDLDKHWKVVKRGPVYIAYAQRPFSYHLLQGEGAEVPYDCDWPRLKAPPDYYAFVGPTKEAVEGQVRLALEQYAPMRDPKAVIEHSAHLVQDETGTFADAILIPHRKGW